MANKESVSPIKPHPNLREFFRDALEDAAGHQRLSADTQTMYYVVNLLTAFTRSEQLYDVDEEGVRLPALAKLLAAALNAGHRGERGQHLQRLGDLALFLSGFFPDQLARKPVDMDYYIAMGGQAYQSLHVDLRGSQRGAALGEVFAELASKFGAFVDALDEVAEALRADRDSNVLRLYELWLKTGSPRLAEKLRRQGIEPNEAGRSRGGH